MFWHFFLKNFLTFILAYIYAQKVASLSRNWSDIYSSIFWFLFRTSIFKSGTPQIQRQAEIRSRSDIYSGTFAAICKMSQYILSDLFPDMNSDICCGCEIAMKACQVETCSVPGTQIRMARWKLETLTRQVVKQIFCFELFPRWLYFLMGMHGCKYIYNIYIYIYIYCAYIICDMFCSHHIWKTFYIYIYI